MNRLTVIILAVILLAGCQYPIDFRSEEEIKEDVLGQDPSFGTILGKKAVIDTKMAELRSQLNAKKAEIDSSILVLRREYTSVKENITTNIKELDSQIEPYRQELIERIRSLSAQLKLKESSLSATNKMINRLDKLVVEGKTSKELSKEAPRWKEKIVDLNKQAKELEEEISTDRTKLRLNRLKLRLIK